MDVSNYGIRVVRMRPKSFKMELPVGNNTPIDVLGTVLLLQHNSMEAMRAMQKEDWYSIIFGELNVYARVRWDNDTRATLGLQFLHIVDLGRLPMYRPLYSGSELDFDGKFDRRRAEERRPITVDYMASLIPPKLKRTHSKVSPSYRTVNEPVPAPNLKPRRSKRAKKPRLWKDYYSTNITYNDVYGGYGGTTGRMSSRNISTATNSTSYVDTSDWITASTSGGTGSTN
jgi:hypothetical protein